MNASKPHSELRAKIVAALNLTPLVPPQADTETLNVVEDAWAALSELMRSVEQLEALRRHDEAATQDAVFFRKRMVDFEIALREIESLPNQTEAYSNSDTAILIARHALEKANDRSL